MTPTAQPLDKLLRRKLERTVVQAREQATAAARVALEHLGVAEAKAPEHLDPHRKALRRRLRAHGRQLGDPRHPDGRQEARRLVRATRLPNFPMIWRPYLKQSWSLTTIWPTRAAISAPRMGRRSVSLRLPLRRKGRFDSGATSDSSTTWPS